MRLCYFFLLCYMFSLNISAQKIEIERLSDYSKILKIAVYHGFIWIQSFEGIAQLSQEGKLLRQYDLTNGGIDIRDKLLIGENGEPFIYSKLQKGLLRWDIQKQKWQIVWHLEGDNVDLYEHCQQIWLCDDDNFSFWEKGGWVKYPRAVKGTRCSPMSGDILYKTKKGDIFFVQNPAFCAGRIWSDTAWLRIPVGEAGDYNFFHFQDTLYAIPTREPSKTRWNGTSWETVENYPRQEYWNGQKWQYTDKWEGLKYKPNHRNNYVSTHQNFWIGEIEGGVLGRYENGSFTRWNIPYALSKFSEWADRESINSVCADEKGVIWFASNYGNIYKLEDNKIKHINPKNPLPAVSVSYPQKIFFDKQGCSWFAALYCPAFYEKGKGYALLDTLFERSASPSIYFRYGRIAPRQYIQTADGSIYMAAQNGVFKRLSNGRWQFLLIDEQVFMYLHAKGHLCALGEHGSHYEIQNDGKVISSRITELLQEKYTVHNIVSPAKGEFWLLDNRKKTLYRYKNGKISEQGPSANSQSYNYISLFSATDTSVAVILDRKEYIIYYFDLKTETWTAQNIQTEAQYFRTQIDKLGKIWLQDQKNIYTREEGTNTWSAQKIYNPYQWEDIESFFVDSQQRLWVFSLYQVLVYDLKSDRVLTTTAFPTMMASTKAQEDPQGTIWLMGHHATLLLRLR